MDAMPDKQVRHASAEFSPEEYRQIKVAAAHRDQPITQFLRDAALLLAEQVTPTPLPKTKEKDRG
jgi:uncharacterized protein (DUF1778 family)